MALLSVIFRFTLFKCPWFTTVTWRENVRLEIQDHLQTEC